MRLTPPMRTGSNFLLCACDSHCDRLHTLRQRRRARRRLHHHSAGQRRSLQRRYLTVKNSSSIKENSYSGVFADVVNTGVLYLDGTGTIGVLDGNAAVLIQWSEKDDRSRGGKRSRDL